VVHFLAKFVHNHKAYETTVANLVLIRFILTILLNVQRCCPVILHYYLPRSCVEWMC